MTRREERVVCRNARTERFEQELQGLALVPHNARTDLQNLMYQSSSSLADQFLRYSLTSSANIRQGQEGQSISAAYMPVGVKFNYLPPLSELQLGVVLDHCLDLLCQSIPSLQEDKGSGAWLRVKTNGENRLAARDRCNLALKCGWQLGHLAYQDGVRRCLPFHQHI